MSSGNNTTAGAKTRLLFIGAVLIFLLWFAYQTISVLFLFFFAVVLTLVLNAPVMWLVSKNVPRTLAAIAIFLSMLVFLFLISWLVLPKILEQIGTLVGNLPDYYQSLRDSLGRLLQDYPDLQEKLSQDQAITENLPAATKLLRNIGMLSFSLVGGIFLLVMFFSIVLYMLINPAPLIETYLEFFPEQKQEKAATALANASRMMVGWMWSNLVVGSLEAIAVFFFLSWMQVPGVWVWVGLALFAEMVPKLGLYIMAIPPVLIALSVDPATAFWVLVFYLVLNELMGDLVMPRIRASTMNLHPVSTLFVMLAMASAFGIFGALIATPLTAFVKAYYEAFFLTPGKKERLALQINRILKREP